jgi:uncharacterized membrane protein YhaH (DUF805 family)
VLKYRINRPTYWVSYVAFMALVSALICIGKVHGIMESAMLALGVPRLHDIGRSGWVVVGVIGIEFALLVGLAVAGADIDTILISAGAIFFAIAALGIWLGLIPGQPEANKWGDPPLPGVRFGKPEKRI